MSCGRKISAYCRHKFFRIFSFIALVCGLLLILTCWYLQKKQTIESSLEFFFPVVREYPSVDVVEAEIPARFKINIPQRHLSATFTQLPSTIIYTVAGTKKFITFFVKSAPGHFLRRRIIRQTWGSFARIGTHRIGIVFLIGSSLNDSVNTAIAYENKCFRDVLQTSNLDTFPLLTLKTLTAFRWIKHNLKSKSSFFVFTDDDCVVNVFDTVEFLQARQRQKEPEIDHIYCAFQYEEQAGVIRGNGKLSVPLEQYAFTTFPRFCRGVMVVLTYKVIKEIYDISTVTDFSSFPLEDVLVYGILRSKLNKNNIHISPVINGGKELVFYPWDNTISAARKIHTRWKNLQVPLHWKDKLFKVKYSRKKCSNYSKLVTIR